MLPHVERWHVKCADDATRSDPHESKSDAEEATFVLGEDPCCDECPGGVHNLTVTLIPDPSMLEGLPCLNHR